MSHGALSGVQTDSLARSSASVLTGPSAHTSTPDRNCVLLGLSSLPGRGTCVLVVACWTAATLNPKPSG
eukprot:3023334-Rhodomonas_salina.2